MTRTIFSKVMWVGRATVFLVGLTVIFALVFGMASTAMSATGGNFLLGQRNVADAISTLVKQGPGPALSLVVEANQPPLKVSSSKVVANLNADKVDGKDAPMWVVVNSDATIARQSPEVVSVSRPVCTGCGIGLYTVTFNRNVDRCAYGATIYKDSFTGTVKAGIGQSANQVEVQSQNEDGTFLDNTFNLIVTC